MKITGTLQKRAWDDGSVPPPEQIRPDIWSIPVPIPINPLRYVLVYLLASDSGIAIVDAGWNTDEAWEALNAGIAQAGWSIADVEKILITHIHPDHYGLAGRVRQASGAEIALHPLDGALLQTRYEEPDELISDMEVLLQDAGVPNEQITALTRASLEIRSFVTTSQPDVQLEDGDKINFGKLDLEVIWTPGHSPGHVCFYSPSQRLLFSGDHVLAHITPNVGVHTQQHANPLQDFLASLERVASLDVDEVFPAHAYRFLGLKERAEEIIAHHHRRLNEIELLIRNNPGCTSWELTWKLPWSKSLKNEPLYIQRAANGEIMAHLVVLETSQRIAREGSKPVRYFPVLPET